MRKWSSVGRFYQKDLKTEEMSNFSYLVSREASGMASQLVNSRVLIRCLLHIHELSLEWLRSLEQSRR